MLLYPYSLNRSAANELIKLISICLRRDRGAVVLQVHSFAIECKTFSFFSSILRTFTSIMAQDVEHPFEMLRRKIE